MPTIVDALVVTLGLDPKQFTKGQKDAASAFLRTKEAATKTGKDIESASQKAADSIDRIARNALKLFAIFTAGRAVKDFITDITNADSALGRLATRIGQAPGDISAVASAVNRTGGSFDAAAGSFQRFSDSIQELKTTGNTAILPTLYKIQAAGGRQINLNKDISQTYEDLADNLKAINDTQGAATANYLGRQLGLDEGTIALLVKGSAAYRAQVAASKQLGIATKADTEAAQNLQTSIRTLTQASEGLGRTIMTAVTPIIVDLLKPLEEWIKANREWVATEITARVREFGDYLKTIDWASIGRGIRDFISGANDAAKAIGGWKVAAELFFGLWAATRIVGLFAPLFAQLALVRLTLLRMGPIGWGLLGLGALAGALATADPNKAIVSGGKSPDGALNPGDELPGAGSGTPRSDGGGPGLLRRGWNGIKRLFGSGDADAAEGGAGIRTRARRAGSHHAADDQSGVVPAVPDTVPMTAQERNTLGLIMKHESHGQNTMNYVGKKQGLDPNTAKGYTAQGYYQLLNSNWRRLAPRLGIKTTNAMSSSLEDQTRVALALLRENPNAPGGGVQNWTNYNPTLRAAIARGDKAPQGTVPSVAPSDAASAKTAASATGNPDGSPLPTDGTGVNNDLMRVVKRAQEISAVRFHIHEGLRTLERQKEMVDRGWSKTYNSKHLTGRAVDLRADGDPAVGALDAAKYARINDAMKKASAELGVPVQWGGDSFGKFKDVPHFQLPDSFKSNAGAYPGEGKPMPNNKAPGAMSALQAGAMAAAAQARAAQAAMASNTSNDNRSTVSHDTRFNGPITIQTASTDPDGIARDMEGALRKRSFAMGSNYGQA